MTKDVYKTLNVEDIDIKKISSKYGRINYYISPKLFEEFTGFKSDLDEEDST